MTCLCVMTLEVYYRHLPLYKHIESTDDTATKKKASATDKKTASAR